MRVVITHCVRDGLRRLHITTLWPVAIIKHRVQDAAVHWLQTVPHLREGATHNDRHGVVDVARLHLLANIHRVDAVKKVAATIKIIVAHNSPVSLSLRDFPLHST